VIHAPPGGPYLLLLVDVRVRRSVLDEDVLRDLLRLSRRDEALIDKLAAVAHGLSAEQDLEAFLAAVELEARPSLLAPLRRWVSQSGRAMHPRAR
jgi:hypothetical protein